MEANEPTQTSVAAMATAVIGICNGKDDRHDLDWINATSRARNYLDQATQMMVRIAFQVGRAACKNRKVKGAMMKSLKKYIEQDGANGWHWELKKHIDEVPQRYPEHKAHPTKGQRMIRSSKSRLMGQ